MKVVVVANIDAQKEFESKAVPEGTEVHFETVVPEIDTGGDVFFYLLPETELVKDTEALSLFAKPVFVNAVVATLKDLPTNFVRINGWSGFVQRSIIEVCATEQMKQLATSILEALKWKHRFVPDVPGMVAARTIAMIINEAYFALGDEVSTKEEIDIAMKLGTNYPYGPFEWAEKIGLQNIVSLLEKLSETETRYSAANALLKETRL